MKDTAILTTFHRKFIDGCHILHQNALLDAFGHLSFRHPLKPHVFVMSRSIAPALVSSPSDLIDYWISNAAPLDPSISKGLYAERFIHSEIYKRHRHVNAIVHSHAEAVIPYSIVFPSSSSSSTSNVEKTKSIFQPSFHMAGFLGSNIPIFDTSSHVKPGDPHLMLVNDEHLGGKLAECFDDRTPVALMRGHGFVAVGGNMEQAVSRAIFTNKNAVIQTTALGVCAGAAATLGRGGGGGGGGDIVQGRQEQQQKMVNGDREEGNVVEVTYLSADEVDGTTPMTVWTEDRSWALWAKEVEASPLYQNAA